MSQAATPVSAEPDTLAVVSFMAGGYRCAVEAAQVKAQLPPNHTDTALTAEQLLGLLPNGKALEACHRRILLIKHPTGDYAVTVASPVELRRVDVNAIHPLPDMIAARCRLTGLRGLAITTEGMTLLVDFNTAKTLS